MLVLGLVQSETRVNAATLGGALVPLALRALHALKGDDDMSKIKTKKIGPMTVTSLPNISKLEAWAKKDLAVWTLDELKAAFDNVANAANWKYPINANCKVEDIAVTEAAINFYAGGGAKFGKPYKNHSGEWSVGVSAPGYYELIGA